MNSSRSSYLFEKKNRLKKKTKLRLNYNLNIVNIKKLPIEHKHRGVLLQSYPQQQLLHARRTTRRQSTPADQLARAVQVRLHRMVRQHLHADKLKVAEAPVGVPPPHPRRVHREHVDDVAFLWGLNVC